ncbi:MAG TPA: phage holin family protein [Vicinamibacterales bacterium]|nr:phage holin family protein [Vicinamibacterales bacterium]
MPTAREERSLGELFAELSRDVTILLRKEIELARAEMSQNLARLGRHAAMIAVGGALAYAGLLTIVAALVVILHLFGLMWWASTLIVGIVVALIGYLLLQRGLSAMRKDSLAPTETIRTIKENAAWAKGQRT